VNPPQEGATLTYTHLEGFESLFLEGSWILAVVATPATLVIEADIALTERHPEHRSPRAGEPFCYRRGVIRFGEARALSWVRQGVPPAVDTSGTPDFGSFDQFDQFDQFDGTYTLGGDFGQIVIESGIPTVDIHGDDEITMISSGLTTDEALTYPDRTWTPPTRRDR
jgi:hypothetical protein